MSKHELKLPEFGPTGDEADLLSWEVEVGDRIELGTPLITIETDKATLEVESPVAGTLVEQRAEVGATLASGDVYAVVEA
jgi:2-oxoisovalerate dehydrogenase E2 component (dihydrolipoyl transacylase)